MQDRVDQLIANLEDSSKWVRYNAALGLAEEADPRAVEPLIAVLQETPSAPLAYAIGKALQKLGGPALQHLIRTLSRHHKLPPGGIVIALGLMGDPRAVPLLLRALEPLLNILGNNALICQTGDLSWTFWQRIIHALGETGDKQAIEPLIAILGISVYISGSTVAERNLQQWLPARIESLRESAALALAEIGPAAVEPLIAALKDRSKERRRGAAMALARIADPRTIEPLIHWNKPIAPPAVSNGTVTARALVKIGSPAVPALIDVMKGRGILERLGAIWALGEIGDEQAVEALLEMLNDRSWELRRAAVAALGKIGNERPLPALVKALQDKSADVRREAATALGQMGPSAVDPLRKALADKDKAVRRNAAEALGSIGDTRALDALTRALGDRDTAVRQNAVVALGRIGHPSAVNALVRVLGDRDTAMRQSAVVALGSIGDPSAVEPLIPMLDSRDEELRKLTIQALGKIGPAAADPLIQAMGNAAIYWEAAAALGMTGDRRALSPLFSAINHDDVIVREQAARALGIIGDTRAVDPLIAALADKRWRVREQAGIALGHIGDERALQPLAELRKNPHKELSIMKSAGPAPYELIEPIARIGGPERLDFLYDVLTFGSATIKSAEGIAAIQHQKAAQTLGEIGDLRVLALLEWVSSPSNFCDAPETKALAKEAIGKIKARHA